MKSAFHSLLFLILVLLVGGCAIPHKEADGVESLYFNDWCTLSLWYCKSPEYEPAYPVALIEPLFDVTYCRNYHWVSSDYDYYPEFDGQFDDEASAIAGNLLTDELLSSLPIDKLIEIGWCDENLSLQEELAMTREYCVSLRWRSAPDSLCNILLHSGYRYGILAYGSGEFSSKKAGHKHSTIVITVVDSVEKKFLFSAISSLNKLPTRPKTIQKQVRRIAKILKTPVR